MGDSELRSFPDIQIRPARRDEIETLADLGLSSWINGIKPFVLPSVTAKIMADNPFISFIAAMGPRVKVATVDHEAAGIAACEHDDGKISDLWVSPHFECRGVGRALLLYLEGELAAAGFPSADIEVAAANARAYRLYQHLGYVEIWRATKFDPNLAIALEKIGLRKDLVTASHERTE
ncbi:GNAT family N-acetyltransferase [Oryzifoliimicrobium ureilyticus]|uniref:GNAT family N-acetyltransferase n=1 Tax=Oryzifoliimicrobium ureilyticus TaxID=3113724 RepID=UPI0030768575